MSASARPELIRPFSHKNAPNSARGPEDRSMYSARNQFTQIKRSSENITTDDIVNLKREKQNLLQERTLLKAKLARFADINRHPKAAGRNQQIANSLERQVRTLEQLTASKRAEIAQLIYSDRAAVITELQEESKMLHLELMRLKKTKQETEAELRKVSAELEEACQKYSPAVLTKQQKTIKQLEREISAQQARNEKLKQKIEVMQKDQEANNYDDENAKIQKQIDDLKAKIKEEQQAIAQLDKQMAQMSDEHANEMQELQSQL
ncbi:hypothetical protein TRFO_21040 [Tritrichomonas foetus]|uniref:Uncharacterized protein n=1 Tax=Tritrichomonas foetus TaxID=1144522 RepID=A0A1J4KFI0_9EUKA|nr:hypothetical protein TRFO_21040 [Tritrichomonas foetus]|eukprot:OHT09947.1 hypothetical protein TRFO_21040 [Tritrichomonas foetus]